MRIITDKTKWSIGKRLSAIYYIAVYGFGHGEKQDMECIGKIVEHVCEIAWAVGGERFATIDVPAYVKKIQEVRDGKD